MFYEGYEPKRAAMESSMRRSTSMPPANLFWSDRTQTDHTLEFLRPINLDAHTAPIPQDDDLDVSPRPLQSGDQQGPQDQSQVASFKTPGSPCAEKPQSAAGLEIEDGKGECGDRSAPEVRVMAEKKPERVWNRRAQGGSGKVEESLERAQTDEKHGRQFEEELADEVLLHFQQETARLQSQNALLTLELQRLKDEKEFQKKLTVPPSWSHDRAPTPPPRMSPATHGSQNWMSPDTFRCTPNGTRIPNGPPPPDPPPFPSWPPELASYEIVAEPPTKLRGVMGDRVYQVGGGTCSPRTARNFWLEQEVAALKERLECESLRSKSFQGSYWSKPFQTETDRAREVEESVTSMRRNAGMDGTGMDVGWHEHGEKRLRDRASMEHVSHGRCLHDRAGALVSSMSSAKHGGLHHEDRASIAPEQSLGAVYPRDRPIAAPEQSLGAVYPRDRVITAPEESLGDVCQRDRAGSCGPRERALHHGGALRGDRELVEDGDLKSVPIQLPLLPPPDGRDASLEAGDWLVQLEPLVGDLSKHAASWWKRVMQTTTATYAEWLHADPLSRLKIVSPDNGPLCVGFERLDQRMTSLLLQAVPKSIKDEIIATRELTTAAILFRVMRAYQPGGLIEKSRLLEDLTMVPTTKSAQEVVAALRLWKRKASRASELCAQLPDPLLLIRTLDGIAKPVVDGSHQANFRIASFRMNYSLDIRPSMANVWLFYDLLLAEAEVAVHSATVAVPGEPKTPTKSVKALQSPLATKTTTTASNAWPCKFWLTDGGCRQGQRCRWPHPWEGVTDKNMRCWSCSSNQHLQQDCPYKAQVRSPVGGEGEGNKDEIGGGLKNGDNKGKGKGKGKTKGKHKAEGGQQKSPNKENASTEVKKDEAVSKTTVAAAEDEVKGKNEAATSSSGSSTGDGKKADSGGTGGGTSELLQEATKLLKSLHLPAAKMIQLQELGDLQGNPADLMLLDSGATHSLRRAKSWSEWEQSTPTVVALAQGTTSSLRIKTGTDTLLATPEDSSFGNGILPMGALTNIGYEVKWIGGDCMMKGPDGSSVDVKVVNGCPMIERHLGMVLMEKLENDSRITAARTALVKAIVQQPGLLKDLHYVDPETLLTIMLKKEFPDLPDTICRKVVPRMAEEVNGEQLPWNRRMRRRILKARRVILHLYSGPDQKTWKQLEDQDTVVVCIDKVINSKMDMMNDNVMLFLMKIAISGTLHAIIGGPPCRSVSACRYANDGGPAPVRSEQEPYGMSTLTPQQRQWVEEDITMMFRMKLLYMTAEQYKPSWCSKVLFAMEQPQDPREYRSAEDVAKHDYMSVWRTKEWQRFQDRFNMMKTSFEQGAFGHKKPKPTTFGHNISGLEELDGAKSSPEVRHQTDWKDLSLQERIAESSTWSEWAVGLKAALVEGLRRNLTPIEVGRHHIWALGSAEEAPRDSDCDGLKPPLNQPQLCPLSEVALTKWKAHILNDHQPMRRDCKVCVEAAGKSRQHRRIRHPSAYCLSMDLSGKLKRGKDQFGKPAAYILIGCYTFPTTADDVPLCGPGQVSAPEDAPLPTLDEMVDEDGVCGDVEDGELPRFEAEEVEHPEDVDERTLGRAKASYNSWMKLVEECKQVKVKTLTFTETIASRHTSNLLEGIAKIYSRIRSLGLPVLRLHADRAREFTSQVVQNWCHQRDVVPTYTCGSDWKSNGRAENEIGIVKRHAKVLMRAHAVNEEAWPMLVRHAAERRLRWQLRQVGYPVPALLPFHTKVLVKRKSWNERYAAWRWERSPAKIMGPDPWSSLTSGGYCVQLEDGKFLASTDVVVEQSELGEEASVDLVVQERLQGDQQAPEAPRKETEVQAGRPTSSLSGVGFQLGGESYHRSWRWRSN